jgi:hypothetical protein
MTFGLQCDEPTSVSILDRAAEGGIDFIDSSDVYPLGGDLATVGRTEEILGRWLRGRRDRFVLATKCFGTGRHRSTAATQKHIFDAVDVPAPSTNRLHRLPSAPWFDSATIDETLVRSTTLCIKERSATSDANFSQLPVGSCHYARDLGWRFDSGSPATTSVPPDRARCSVLR